MAIQYKNWKEHQQAIKANEPQRATINEQFLKQAAVDAVLLTGHPGWDKYLQQLQVMLEQAQDELKEWQVKFSGAYSDHDLRLAQRQAAIYEDRILTLKWCMTLPKEIISHAAAV